jgi:hypothetical protein
MFVVATSRVPTGHISAVLGDTSRQHHVVASETKQSEIATPRYWAHQQRLIYPMGGVGMNRAPLPQYQHHRLELGESFLN